MAYYHGRVHLDRFERFELSGDCRKKTVAKPPPQKNPDDFGSGIAAQFGLVKKPATDKRRKSCEDISVKKKRRVSEDEYNYKTFRSENSHHGKHKKSLVDTNQHKSTKKSSSNFANTSSDNPKKNNSRQSKDIDSSDVSSDDCSNSKRRKSVEDIPVKRKRKPSEDEDNNKIYRSRDKSVPLENSHHGKQKKSLVDTNQHKLTKSSASFTSTIFDQSKNVLSKVHTKSNESRDLSNKSSNSDKSRKSSENIPTKKKKIQPVDIKAEPDDEISDNDNANFFNAISDNSKKHDVHTKHSKSKDSRDLLSSNKSRKNSEDIPEKKKRVQSVDIKSEPDDEISDNDNANFFNAISDRTKKHELLVKHKKNKESRELLANEFRKNTEDIPSKKKRVDEDNDKLYRSRDKTLPSEISQHGKEKKSLVNMNTVYIKSEPDEEITDTEHSNIFNSISDQSKDYDMLTKSTKSNESSVVKEKRKVQARIINLGNDLRFIGKTKDVNNSRGKDLTDWFELVNDRLREKSTKTDNTVLNYFITLHSRFKVMETMEMNDLEVLPEEEPEKEADVEPIRIFTNLSKDHYRQYLDEACLNSIPELIITKLYPKCS